MARNNQGGNLLAEPGTSVEDSSEEAAEPEEASKVTLGVKSDTYFYVIPKKLPNKGFG